MSTASPTVRALAGRLIAFEAARDDPRVAPAGAAARVCEKLRLPLTYVARAFTPQVLWRVVRLPNQPGFSP